MTTVPRPGVDRTTNVPLASSTRSRIDARPDAAHAQVLARPRCLEPADRRPRSRPGAALIVGLDVDHHVRRLRVLADVRERLLDDAIGERLQVVGDRSLRSPANSVRSPCSVSEAVDVSRSAGINPRSSSTGGRRPAISCRRASASLGELLADLRRARRASIDVAGLDHEQRRFQRERCGRHALHRAVVQVARDPVAFLPRSRRSTGGAAACGPRRGPAGTGTASGSSGRRPSRR